MFGSICFHFLRPYNKSKLQYRSAKCVFIGYSPSHKGYLCLHPSGKIFISDTVNFNEEEFPYSSLFHDTTTTTYTPTLPTHAALPNLTQTSSQHASAQNNILPGASSSSSISTQNTAPDTYSPLHTSDYSSNSRLSLVSTSDNTNSTNQGAIFPTNSQPQNTHTMITRSKAGVYKPKIYTTILSHLIPEPDTVSQALMIPE